MFPALRLDLAENELVTSDIAGTHLLGGQFGGWILLQREPASRLAAR